MKLKLLSILFVALLFSCKSGKNNTDKMKTLESGLYTVQTVSGENVSQEKMTLNIDLDKHRISGKSSCNNYGAGFLLNNKSIDMSYAHATKMFCKGKMKLEHSFMSALAKVETYDYDGKLLELQDGNGKTLITAKKTNAK